MGAVISDTVDFDDIFYSKHGVSDVAPDKEQRELGHAMDRELPTIQEVDYALRVAKGENHTDSYIIAFGFKGDELSRQSFSNASRKIRSRPRVSKKIIELKEKAAAIAEEDLPNLIQELNEDRKLARDLGQPSAAITAVKTKANLLGLEQSGSVTNNVNLNLSDEQKAQLLDRVSKRIDAPAPIDVDYEVVDE